MPMTSGDSDSGSTWFPRPWEASENTHGARADAGHDQDDVLDAMTDEGMRSDGIRIMGDIPEVSLPDTSDGMHIGDGDADPVALYFASDPDLGELEATGVILDDGDGDEGIEVRVESGSCPAVEDSDEDDGHGWFIGLPRLVHVSKMCGAGDVTPLMGDRLPHAFVRRYAERTVFGDETGDVRHMWTQSPPVLVADMSGITSFPETSMQALGESSRKVSSWCMWHDPAGEREDEPEIPPVYAAAVVPDAVPDAVTGLLGNAGIPIAVSVGDLAEWLDAEPDDVRDGLTLTSTSCPRTMTLIESEGTRGWDTPIGMTATRLVFAGGRVMRSKVTTIGFTDDVESDGDPCPLWMYNRAKELALVVRDRRAWAGLLVMDVPWRTGKTRMLMR